MRRTHSSAHIKPAICVLALTFALGSGFFVVSWALGSPQASGLLRLGVTTRNHALVAWLVRVGVKPNLDRRNDDVRVKAVMEDDAESLSYLLDAEQLSTSEKSYLLSLAIAGDSSKSARVILVSGANPNHVDLYGNTPLREAVLDGNHQLVAILMSFGADPLTEDKTGFSPLAYSLTLQDLRTLELLVGDRPIAADARYGDKLTLLDFARAWARKSKDGASALRLLRSAAKASR